MPDLQTAIQPHEARVNVTYAGGNGDLPDPVRRDASDQEIRTWIGEALRSGTIPGLPTVADPDLADFVLDRFAATEARPYALIQLRPKTPFGQSEQ